MKMLALNVPGAAQRLAGEATKPEHKHRISRVSEC